MPRDGVNEAHMDGIRGADSSDMDLLTSQEGMVDVDLTQSAIDDATGLPLPLMSSADDGSKFSRLSASMFSPNMSSFYQNARGILNS